jgi:FkbM family methyltransferase
MRAINLLGRLLAPLPVRGKGRLANALARGFHIAEAECYPAPAVRIRLDFSDRIQRWMWAGVYERELVAILKSCLRPGMTVLDIGANIGYFSALAAALVGPEGRVYAFEPCPSALGRLRVNAAGYPWIEVWPVAVSDTSGCVVLFESPREDEGGWASLVDSNPERRRCEVECITLDDWLLRAAPPRVDFVKMDIEGAECRALAAAGVMLQTLRPVVVAEVNQVNLALDGRRPEDLRGRLHAFGYDTYPIENGGSLLAIPKEKETARQALRRFLRRGA